MHFALFLLIPSAFALRENSDYSQFDDNALYKINWPGRTEIDIDLEKYEPLYVTTHEDEKYKCLIPKNAKEEQEQEYFATAISPVHIISPIFSTSSCSYRIEAYWTYEICHGHHVKQYHEERDGKNIKLQEYFLGKWDGVKSDNLIRKIKEDLESGRNFRRTKIDNVNYPYLELEMDDGTLCDINNEPRITRVRYICQSRAKNEIYSLKETSTCNYEAVILTSVLCKHRAFVPEDSDESVINCLPVDGSHEWPHSWLKNELDDIKKRHKLLADAITSTRENIAILEVDPQDGSLRLMDILPAENPPRRTLKVAIEEYLEKTAGNTAGNRPTPDHPFEEEESPAVDLPLPPAPQDVTPVSQFLEGKNCLTGGTGWWKFEFCYGRYVRQFHVDKNGESSLFLGFFDENLHKDWLKKNPEKRPKPNSVRNDISHFYQGGTMCDKTGENRQTEVKLKCLENASSASSVSMYLLEPKTCQYILVVESPLICEILQKVDDNGLVGKSPLQETTRDSKPVESVYIGNVQVDDLEVRYEND